MASDSVLGQAGRSATKTGFPSRRTKHAALHAKLPYDPIQDFAPITLMWNYPSVVVVPQNSPAKSISDIVELAKANPGHLTFGSQGVGTTGYLLPAKMMVDQCYKGARPRPC